ncbi:MAG: acylphosphatase [Rhodothermales bacterium]
MEHPGLTVEWIVRGRVQGVGFRAYTAQCAREMRVMGWVANRRDGSVVVVAEGPVDALRGFEALVKRGPALARVDSLTETAMAPAGYTRFEIRQTT